MGVAIASKGEIPEMSTRHVSVMKAEIVRWVNAERGGYFLDCTLGGAGHTEAILEANSKNRVVGLDRDLRALDRARERLRRFGDRVELIHAAFSGVGKVLEGRTFDGVIADLGLSTDQLFEGRGFSFRDEVKLDMRMDETQFMSADQVVNQIGEKELSKLLRDGGVGVDSRRYARIIFTNRPFETAKQLADLIERSSSYRDREGGHPATVVFQAIRMYVNREIEEIKGLFDYLPELVNKSARLAVIAFHSTEDQIVTKIMRRWAQGDTRPARLRDSFEVPVLGELLSKKAIVPGEEEIIRNPSARSARLRVFEFARQKKGS